MPFGRGVGIETHRKVSGFLIVHQIEQGIQKAKLCIGIFSGTGNARTSNQGIIGTENKGKGIEQEETFIHAVKVR